MIEVKHRPADGRSTPWTVAEVLAAVEQAGDNAAAIAHTVSDWAAPPIFRITGGTGRNLPIVHSARQYRTYDRYSPPRSPDTLR